MATLGFLGVAVLTGGAAELRGVGMETRSCPLLPAEGAPTLSDGSSLPMANTLSFSFGKQSSFQSNCFPISQWTSVCHGLSGGPGLPGGWERGGRGWHPRADAS